NTLSEVIGPPGSNIRGIQGHGAHGDYVPPTSLLLRRQTGLDIGGWRDPRVTTCGVDVDLARRLRAAGCRFVTVPALTAFKFNAAHRVNSYKEKPSFQQAEYARRIGSERAFLVRELAALGAARLRRREPHVPDGFPIGE